MVHHWKDKSLLFGSLSFSSSSYPETHSFSWFFIYKTKNFFFCSNSFGLYQRRKYRKAKTFFEPTKNNFIFACWFLLPYSLIVFFLPINESFFLSSFVGHFDLVFHFIKFCFFHLKKKLYTSGLFVMAVNKERDNNNKKVS